MGCQWSREFAGYGATKEQSITSLLRYVRFYYPYAVVINEKYICTDVCGNYSPIHFSLNEEGTLRTHVVICTL